MTRHSGSKLKRGIANTFGAFGYLFCSLQWFWVVMLYLTVVQSAVSWLTPPVNEQAPQLPRLTVALPNQVELVIIVVVVVVMVALTIYGLVKLPFSLAKAGRKTVHKTTEKVVPIVIKAQHKKDTKKQRKLLTVRIRLVMKLLLIFVPIVLTASSGILQELPIGHLVAVTIGGGIAAMSILMFAIQYLLAVWLRVTTSELW